MFVIICDARYKKHSNIVFMVDRSKRKDTFWSLRLSDALIWTSENAAKEKCKTLHLNNPKVIGMDEALKISKEIEKRIDYEEAMNASESGWDGHK